MMKNMKKPFDILNETDREKLKEKKMPDWIDPMLATLTKDRFSKEEWIYERKFDGERCLVYKDGSSVKMMSRNKKVINSQYPEIEDAFKKMTGHFIVDGEIVSFTGNVTSFSRLQKRMHSQEPDLNVAVYYYTFDIIHLDGFDLSELPLRSRKSLLRSALDFDGRVIRYTPHRNDDGEDYYQEACEKHWEGLIAKDAHSAYSSGRSTKWLKFKCENRQELVICGYTDPEGEREYFGALLTGFYEKGELRYAGKVGTGYDEETLERLYKKMHELEQDHSPYDHADVKDKHVHWLKPQLVGQFRFTEWTGDNKLRHPSFLGLRKDKKAREVKKETVK